ncbi:MAG: aminoacyl-tRNA hydrolase [Parcubacteria group bacterium]|jgi:PTH1 family peptidyl-tRNA hydrolase
MKIIIGLGNPGKEYAGTRHNIGFVIVNKLQETWEFPEFEFNKKFDSEISEGFSVSSRAKSAADEVEGSTPEKILLLKPQTFMNLSGEVVRDILAFYKLTTADILVIHDDLDIALGKYKIATDSSSAGHNGVQNIIEQLGSQKFTRVRVGIGEATEEGAIKCRLGAHDFVLDKFTTEEKEKIQAIEKNVLEEIKKLL